MNCIIVDDDAPSRKILEKLVSKAPQLDLIQVCESAVEAVTVLQNEAVDLILLDVDMPEMTGLELIESLREKPQIILVTGKTDFAAEAFNLDVADYLVKPPNTGRFLKAVDKAQQRYEQQFGNRDIGDFIFLKKDGALHKVKTEEVVCIEAMADYVTFFTDQGRYTTLSTMHALEARLPKSDFMRVHRSHIINLKRLDLIEDNTATVGDKLIPIGASYRQRLLKSINLI